MSSKLDNVINFFKREGSLKLLDRVIKNEYALLFGAGLFWLVLKMDWWNWIEPFLTIVVLPVGAATWYEHWRAKNKRYAPESVDGNNAVIVSVDVNTDTAASVRSHFGCDADVYIRSQTELGKTFLDPDDVSKLAKIVYLKCAPYRNRTIYLVLAGPAGLCFQVGQLLAAHKFDVVPLSWARDHYQALPRLGIDDIGQ